MPSDPTKLKVSRTIDRPGICLCLARVPGTTRVFYGSSDSKVYEGDLAAETPEWIELAGHEGYVTGVAVAGDALVSGAYDGRLIWWDIASRQQLRSVQAHDKWVRGVTVSPDKQWIASVSDDMKCRLWRSASGEPSHTLEGHARLTPQHYPSMLFTCAFSPDSTLLATADKVGRIVVWEVASGQPLAELDAPEMYTWDPRQRRHSIGGIRSLAFSPDGVLLAAGGTGQINNVDHLESLARIEVFDWRQKTRTHELPGDRFKGLVECLAFHPDGEWLMATGGDHGGFIKFISLAQNQLIHQSEAPMHVHGASLADSFDSLYAAGHGKLVTFEFQAG